MKLNDLFIYILFLTIPLLNSCESLEDTYKEFTESGEITYIGKADSIKTRGGRNRIELSWLLLSDPKVSNYKIFWNNQNDFVEDRVVKTSQVDTVKHIIEGIDEGEYQFDIYLYDDDGNSSIRSSVRGVVYGEDYERSLLNRTFTYMSRENEDLIIEWMATESDVLYTELEYKNTSGEIVNKIIESTNNVITLTDFPVGGEFTYRTVFIPEPTSLDHFYSAYSVGNERVVEPPEPIGEWRFDNSDNLLEAFIGNDLTLVGSHNIVSGPTSENGAISIDRGSHYVVEHGIDPRRGDEFVNEFSILYDVRLPAVDRWRTLLQTNPANDDDGELFINPSGLMGNGNTTYTSKGVSADTWHRIIVTVKNDFEYSIYLDTEKVLTGNVQPKDGRFGLQPSVIIFGDNDGDDGLIEVAKFAIYDVLLIEEEVEALGKVKVE